MITSEDYVSRRKKLALRLPQHSVAVIPAGTEQLRNGDAHYRFRQDSDFFYLTGFQEPDAVLVILGKPNVQSILFMRPRNAQEEQWTGKRLDLEAAPALLGVDRAFPLADLDAQLLDFFSGCQAVVYALAKAEKWDEKLLKAFLAAKKHIRSGIQTPEALIDLDPFLSELRLFKTEKELHCMREAARITVAGHQRAMRACRHLKYEYELEAELLYEFTRQGCRATAYDSIVAGGENACVLHYTANDAPLQDEKLVLIDAGAEYACYAADVTRTFPVKGQFSEAQKALYECVLSAQKAGIETIAPGVSWDAIQRVMVEILTQGLIDLGILKGSLQNLIEQQAYKSFYMHNSGHWLGLDVHDCGRYRVDGAWRPLEKGMVLTVEPGLYISPGIKEVDSCWWGIGIRIEDDIVVTAEGHENLTADLSKEVVDLEAILRD